MKAELESIENQEGSSLNVRLYNRWNFEGPRGIHYHPEFEIVYIDGGNGNRLIKNRYSQYNNGDLLVIGPNILHHGIEDSVHGGFNQIVIQFPASLFNDRLGAIPEFQSVAGLLDKATGVLTFSDPDKHEIGREVSRLPDTDPPFRVFELMKILKKMSRSDYAVVFPEEDQAISDYDRVRLSDMMNYFQGHLEDGITLHKVATHLKLNESSLCRFVKRTTGKTFSTLLNEFRVSWACDLLYNPRLTITEVSMRSGYGSVSNFNSHFRRIMHMSPSDFRKKLLKNY